ncbi:unnamed protein product [Cuscuta europaea]|uniref:Uncharacterized protein n=1 Tax=Cuscuta europaea TaxID=41803 RepID=A0A9P0Z682_CUSEU|nr:unnamed protein product [Cuscuta europaea]
MEIKSNALYCEEIHRQFGFHDCVAVDSVGLSGGPCLLWREQVEVTIKTVANTYIDAIIRFGSDGPVWCYTGYYGFPERSRRRESWELIHSLSRASNELWLVTGGF